jgi:hypothetical protein
MFILGEAMTRFLSTRQIVFLLLFSSFIILQACAVPEKVESNKKVGMHIDTVLDFVVEYPLSWGKDRRITYGNKDGEVRWTHPEYPETLLRIESHETKEPEVDLDKQLDHVLQRYVGLEISRTEQLAIPSGETWHISGQTAHKDVDIYLLLHSQRSYLIVLTTSHGTLDDHSDIMAEILSSFQVLQE